MRGSGETVLLGRGAGRFSSKVLCNQGLCKKGLFHH